LKAKKILQSISRSQ